MRRVSAGELEQRYKLKHLLLDFCDNMRYEMYENLEEKGFSWQNCNKTYLKKKLIESMKAGNFVNVANYAFMLDERASKELKKRK